MRIIKSSAREPLWQGLCCPETLGTTPELMMLRNRLQADHLGVGERGCRLSSVRRPRSSQSCH